MDTRKTSKTSELILGQNYSIGEPPPRGVLQETKYGEGTSIQELCTRGKGTDGDKNVLILSVK